MKEVNQVRYSEVNSQQLYGHLVINTFISNPMFQFQFQLNQLAEVLEVANIILRVNNINILLTLILCCHCSVEHNIGQIISHVFLALL